MYNIENEHLRITVAAHGAELQGLFSKTSGLEYLWNGDAQYWPRYSPVLFPIVGALKNDTYIFDANTYQLSRHGFARDLPFTLAEESPSSLSFFLEHSATTLRHYPFPFRLNISYTIESATLHVHYQVINTGSEDMYFSIGGHPAFRLPLEPSLSFDDYYFEFSSEEQAPRWPVTAEGLIDSVSRPLLNDSRRLPITHELFYEDALVFKHLHSDRIFLKSDQSPHGLELFFPGFPFLGLWSAKDAPFVCIEPWCGIADNPQHSQQLIHKEGIQQLRPGMFFNRQWSVRVY